MLEEAQERAWQKSGLAEAQEPRLPRAVMDLIESGKRNELIAALEKWG